MKNHHANAHGESIAGVEISCTWCGSVMRRKPSLINDNLNFCNKTCESKWKSDGNSAKENHPQWKGGDATLVCVECGSDFTRRQVRSEQSLYCSFDCKGAAQSRRQRGADNPAWSGGRDFYTRIRAALSGPSWGRVAEKVRERHNYRCQTCGVHQSEIGRKLDVHHLVAVMSGGSNGDYNLLPFCPSCHKTAETFSRQFNSLLLAD